MELRLEGAGMIKPHLGEPSSGNCSPLYRTQAGLSILSVEAPSGWPDGFAARFMELLLTDLAVRLTRIARQHPPGNYAFP